MALPRPSCGSSRRGIQGRELASRPRVHRGERNSPREFRATGCLALRPMTGRCRRRGPCSRGRSLADANTNICSYKSNGMARADLPQLRAWQSAGMTSSLDPRLTDLSLGRLRRRQSAKWRRYPPDVLPAWVAEMDFPLAEPAKRALLEAIGGDDCGYASPDELGKAFSHFVLSRHGWRVDPGSVSPSPGTQPRPSVRPAGRRLRPAQLRHLAGADRRGGGADRAGGRARLRNFVALLGATNSTAPHSTSACAASSSSRTSPSWFGICSRCSRIGIASSGRPLRRRALPRLNSA